MPLSIFPKIFTINIQLWEDALLGTCCEFLVWFRFNVFHISGWMQKRPNSMALCEVYSTVFCGSYPGVKYIYIYHHFPNCTSPHVNYKLPDLSILHYKSIHSNDHIHSSHGRSMIPSWRLGNPGKCSSADCSKSSVPLKPCDLGMT